MQFKLHIYKTPCRLLVLQLGVFIFNPKTVDRNGFLKTKKLKPAETTKRSVNAMRGDKTGNSAS